MLALLPILVLLQIATPRPIDPTVAVCDELIFSRDEVDDLIIKLQERQKSLTPRSPIKNEIQVIEGNYIERLQSQAKPKEPGLKESGMPSEEVLERRKQLDELMRKGAEAPSR